MKIANKLRLIGPVFIVHFFLEDLITVKVSQIIVKKCFRGKYSRKRGEIRTEYKSSPIEGN